MTAALLPLTFLWLCAACAFICGRETAPAAGHQPGASSAERTEVGGTPGCPDCPFAFFPKATAPERAAFDAGPQTASAEMPLPPAIHTQAVAGHVRPRGHAPPTAAPLQLLPTLRI